MYFGFFKKKEVAKFKLSDSGGYWWDSKNSPEFDLVAHFLITDISTRKDTPFTDWLDKPHMVSMQGNTAFIELLEDEIVEIRDVLDDFDLDDPVFRMPKEEFRKMVLQWQKIVANRPKEIVVTWDGEKIRVEGKD